MKFYKLLILITVLVSCTNKNDAELLIASASSLRPVLEDLIDVFSKQEKIKVDFVTASSGKLSAQIEAGAPYDVFLSANEKYPNYLQSKLKIKEEVFTFAYGSIVFLMSLEIGNEQLSWVSFVKKKETQKIVIPNPELAPYGIAANEVLEKKEIQEILNHKMVFAENVSQTNQFIKSGVVDGGFTSLSSVRSGKFDDAYSIVSISDTLYNPIVNTLLITSKNKEQQEKAQKFKAFLQSLKAKRILEKYGFRVPK